MGKSTGPPRGASLVGVGAFTLTYLAVASLAAWRSGNGEFVFYIAVMAILIAAVLAIHRRVGFSAPLLWALSFWGALHMAGGLAPVPESWPIDGSIRVLYSLWLVPGVLKYDQVTHALGFAITTWACWEALRASLAELARRPKSEIGPRWGWVSLCALAAQGFGAMNEIVEFAATQLMPQTNVGGYENTGWDLVANLTGSVIAAVAIVWFGNRANPR